MDYDTLRSRHQYAQRKLDQEIGQLKALVQQVKELESLAQEDEDLALAAAEASIFMNSFADERLAEVHRKIEKLVTHALQHIFGDDLEFALVSEIKANRTETRFVVRSTVDGQTLETSVLDARGGGVAAVVGFLVKLVILLLTPGARRVMFCDETFAQLSADYEPKLADFLRELVDKAGIQVVLVTHSDAYSDAADMVHRFKMVGGKTVVETEKTEREAVYSA